jgi:hypothetical protein
MARPASSSSLLAPAALLLAFAASASRAASPVVTLGNAAVPGTLFPVMGHGDGGYGHDPKVAKPECWSELSGCGAVSYNATLAYIQTAWAMGEKTIRIDNGLSYENVKSVGKAIADSGVPRANVFLVVKVGNPYAMGYDDITAQIKQGLLDSGTGYYDSIYVHWPTSSAKSLDPVCNAGAAFNATTCRLNSYRALVDAFHGGLAKSIGVSNYDAAQMQEIVSAGMPWPAVNQIPIHLYRSSSQMQSILFAQRHGITVNAYSPLGVPDWHVYPAPMSPTELQDPLVLSLAAKYGKSPAQILVGWLWQLGVTCNPRTLDPAHMLENLNAFEQTLTDGEVSALLASPQDWCKADSGDCEWRGWRARARARSRTQGSAHTRTLALP